MGTEGNSLCSDVFINDWSNRMNCDVQGFTLSAEIQTNAPKLTELHITVQMDKDPKHTAKATWDILKAKMTFSVQVKSPDLSLIQDSIQNWIQGARKEKHLENSTSRNPKKSRDFPGSLDYNDLDDGEPSQTHKTGCRETHKQEAT